MRQHVLITASTLVLPLLTGCQSRPESHPTERETPAAISALAGIWRTRKTRAGDYLASTMTIYPRGTFSQLEVTKIKGAGPLTVLFSGYVTPIGGRRYRFFATRQGDRALPPDQPVTCTLSPGGTALRYGNGRDRVTYHRASEADASPTPARP
ncbi:hypothetical protein [Actinoallomurus iriomotensis]|uniref:Lipoprotein n=1 Tax=Actinoallomurus iriomotensis TaxID=478107 RepID=A0A9W6S5H8_9ACTN|nr:hypothetical protein [Actinoallomurus iriomotensis]GLY87449.1 hypothetical protein Airi02_053780 [Actinoallomurus iriomotensis]